jgi:hypothetical protein
MLFLGYTSTQGKWNDCFVKNCKNNFWLIRKTGLMQAPSFGANGTNGKEITWPYLSRETAS